MPEKKIIIITYYWPPSGGPAVQRWLSFTNEMTDLGWEVFVITVDEKYATYQLYDETHVRNIHEKIKVSKTRTREPFSIFKFFFGKKNIPAPGFSNESNPSMVKKMTRFIRGNFFIPDPRKGWKPFILEEAAKIINTYQVNNVLTAGPPHSTHLAGSELKKKFPTVSWTCDFHDLWTDVIYYDLLYHLKRIKKKDARLEKMILEECDKIITVGIKYKNKLLSKSEKLHPDKIHISRIGYDQRLFQEVTHEPQKEFIITYTGTLADYYHPGIFFRALKNVITKYSHITFTLRFVGVVADSIQEELEKEGLGTILDVTGYVSHEKAVAYTRSSTILLLVNPMIKDEEMIIPGKIYEYLAARKPIINITKTESETSQLIAQCYAGKTFERNMQVELEEYLVSLVDTWILKRTLDLPYSESFKQFSRREIAFNLQEFLLH